MLSQTAEYALRSVSFLAKRYPELATATEISAMTQVPQPYLVKVLQALRRAGIVNSQRGIGGGVRLDAPLEKLTMLDVINAVDPIQRITVCPLGLSAHKSQLCAMHSRLDRALGLLEEIFSEVNLAEILAEPPADPRACRFPHVKAAKAKAKPKR